MPPRCAQPFWLPILGPGGFNTEAQGVRACPVAPPRSIPPRMGHCLPLKLSAPPKSRRVKGYTVGLLGLPSSCHLALPSGIRQGSDAV